MKILGIETSCDETSASLVENGVTVLTQVIATSLPVHKKTGGIVPENAARKQVEYIIPVIREALQNSNFDAIAVTESPGLVGSLVVGIETAKVLSLSFNKPLYFVNHIKGHIYSLWLDNKELPEFPFVTLVASGGHTEIYLVKSYKECKMLGATRDDAVGECFDKVARVLGLGYPGGPVIDSTAEKIKKCNNTCNIFRLPRPMIGSNDCEFSFSGLKTAVYKIATSQKLTNDQVADLAFEFRETAVDILITKLLFAAKNEGVSRLAVVGGVSANALLRKRLESLSTTYEVYLPHLKYTGDNAAMIASAGYFINFLT
jgi:N6-L-threonylcarbamoyladenine synthase